MLHLRSCANQRLQWGKGKTYVCAYGAEGQGAVKVTTRDISPHKGFGVLGSILIGSLKIDCAKEFWGCVLRRYAHKKKKKTGQKKSFKLIQKCS